MIMCLFKNISPAPAKGSHITALAILEIKVDLEESELLKERILIEERI